MTPHGGTMLHRPHESPYENKGWGRRYRVRIVGLHEQGEGVTPSEKLPLANLMYPVTAGSGNAASMQSPNLRQGNIVYGFFFDGQEMRIPVIMGVLGNNAQTERATTIGDNRVTDKKPGSLELSPVMQLEKNLRILEQVKKNCHLIVIIL